MMYEKMAEEIKKRGGTIICATEVVSIKHNSEKISSVVSSSKDGGSTEWPADYFISSMPINELVKGLSPHSPNKIKEAAENLYYRSHVTVNFVVKKQNVFSDNWIYIHDQRIKMARLSDYTNFSKEMSKDENKLIACEYFVFENDELWKKSDEGLKNLAIKELEALKFLSNKDIGSWFVLREKSAYPAYYTGYKESLNLIRSYLDNLKNLQLIGRGGMYRYNNMDHAILTGLLAARNILGEKHDIWMVNAEYEYHEEIK